MSSDMFIIEESTQHTSVRIVAVGVGGGGGNMIGHMIKEGVSGIELVVANTDAQVLDSSLANTKIQLGGKLTKGLGAGMKPSIGKDSALESYDELRMSLDGADIVFIAAGLWTMGVRPTWREAFSPFIPLNTDDSTLPATVMRLVRCFSIETVTCG